MNRKQKSFFELFMQYSQPVRNQDLLPASRYQDNFRQIWELEHEAVLVDVIPADTHGIVLRDFKAVTQGQGYGGAALELLTDMADKTGNWLHTWAVATLHSDENGKLNPEIPQEKLVQLYERHRFFRNPVINSDMPRMFRPPQRSR